jgi:DNA primase
MEVYATETQRTTGGAPYALGKSIAAIKQAISIATAANDLGADLRPSGEDFRGKGICHGGANETALLVEPDRGRWYCFRCSEGGDVLDLYIAVEGGGLPDAVVALAERYAVELPRRPERWHAWNNEKGRRREELARWRARRYQRRFYALFAAEGVAAIEDEAERVEEMNRCWSEMGALARAWAARSMGGTE